MYTDDHPDERARADALVDDPFLEAELDRALGPYDSLMEPEALEVTRELLGDLLAAHPLGRKLLNRARPRPTLHRSDTIDKTTGAPAAQPAEPPRAPARGRK